MSRRQTAKAAACLVAILALSTAPGPRRACGRIMLKSPTTASTPGADTAARGIPTGNPSGVHLKNHGSISFRSGYHKMTDGGGYLWDLQYYGSVSRGTPYAYGGGMYCRINNSNVQANNSAGWRNKSGDEIEIGPCSRSGLKAYRRIKVYKDRPLARWLEILENPGESDIKVNVQIYTGTRYSVVSTVTSSGKNSFGPNDWAFRTVTSGSRGVPTLHVVTSKGAKLRPAVRIQSSTIYTRYNGLVVPAGKTVILCHFESQHRDASVHSKMMSKFPLHELMSDLPMSVRVRILNMKAGSSFGGVDLERLDNADNVLLKNDDPLVGDIRNESFRLSTVLGPLELKTDDIIGMAAGPTGTLRFALTDGQVVSGESPGAKLDLALGGGGVLHVPLEKIAQWSFRISPDRPDEAKKLGPHLVLTSGDHLELDPADGPPALPFQWACGRVNLDAASLADVSMTAPGNGKYHAVLKGGTRISGTLVASEPQGLVFDVKMGGRIRIKPARIAAVRFAEASPHDGTLTSALLTGGDKLLGELTDDVLVLTTSYGKASINVSQIKSITFKAGSPDQTAVKKWDGSSMKGKLNATEIGFAPAPDRRWSLPIGKIVSITCPQAIPPKAMRLKIKKLIAQLGADNYKDRQAASKSLVGMGKGIVNQLKPHLSDEDAEVRQRIEDILEQLGVKAPAPSGSVTIDPTGGQWQIEQGGQIIIKNGGVINLNGRQQLW